MFIIIFHLLVALHHGLGPQGAGDSESNRDLSCNELTTQWGRQDDTGWELGSHRCHVELKGRRNYSQLGEAWSASWRK